jgi:hypothetical protein
MKLKEEILKKKNKIEQQKKELVEINESIRLKAENDTAIYGKPLKNKQLRDKASSKMRAIAKTTKSLKALEEKMEERLNRKFKLSSHDSKVLKAIRNNSHTIANTSMDEKANRADNRYNGSANSRKQAKRYFS